MSKFIQAFFSKNRQRLIVALAIAMQIPPITGTFVSALASEI